MRCGTVNVGQPLRPVTWAPPAADEAEPPRPRSVRVGRGADRNNTPRAAQCIEFEIVEVAPSFTNYTNVDSTTTAAPTTPARTGAPVKGGDPQAFKAVEREARPRCESFGPRPRSLNAYGEGGEPRSFYFTSESEARKN